MASRKRSSSSRPAPGFGRGMRIADLMTREHSAFVDSSNAAERAGDASTALEYHQGIPMFRRSSHRVLLTQLADLADEMTPWLWARWAAYQCTRIEDSGTEGADISRAALDYTLRMFHADDLQRAFVDGDDPVRIMARTLGEDWVYHQICTYGLGGLDCFLDTMATGRLAEQAEVARAWGSTLIGGYRIESASPGRLVVQGLAEGRSLEVLDLGASLHAGADGWLIGRLVRSGTTPELMYDSRPLPVDRRTATEASQGDRRGAWVTALSRAIDDGRIDRAILQSEDRELATDVPSLALLERGTTPGDLAGARDRLASGRDEIGRVAYRILRAAAEGTFGSDDEAPYVAASALHPHGYAEAERDLTRPDHRAAWEHWSQLVPEPARGRLLRLAELSAASAA